MALVSTPAMVCTGVQEKPSAVVGTTSIEMPRCFLASGLVRTASHTQSAYAIRLVHIFWPLIT